MRKKEDKMKIENYSNHEEIWKCAQNLAVREMYRRAKKKKKNTENAEIGSEGSVKQNEEWAEEFEK